MGLRAVIFDFDGTLVDYMAGDKQAIMKVWRMLPQGIDPIAFYEASGEVIMEFHQLVEAGADPVDEHRYRLFHSLAKFDLPWQEEYLAVYERTFHSCCPVFPDARELLQAVAKRVPLAILTNAYNVTEQRQRIVASGLAGYFQDIVISGEIGCYKPNPEAFWAVTNRLDVPPGQTFFVGDSEKHDILGAKEAGLKAIKILHRPRRPGEGSAADYLCIDFAEVAALMDGWLK